MHFTYLATPDREHLHQGDVIRRTPEVVEILREVHPHYVRPEYRHFAVLTQSCDLVRRDGAGCKSRYITVAAVRSFSLALSRFIQSLQHDPLEKHFGFLESGRKSKVEQFVQRLLNNNESEYFYLHRSGDLAEDSCVFLRLSVALKSQHYQSLLDAKLLQLTEPFEHKLGYLVSSVYGRVGTVDWAPDTMSESEFRKEASKRVGAIEDVQWLQREVYRQVYKDLKGLPEEQWTTSAFLKALQDSSALSKNKVERMLQLIRTQLEGLVDEDVMEKSLTRLQNKPEFRSMIK